MPEVNKDKNGSANVAKEKNKEFVFHTNNVWLLDSGASNHTCCLKDMFSTIRPYESVIKVGDGRELEVKGIGEVELETIKKSKYTKIKIADTFFVPDMRANLISIGKLSKKGFIVLFQKNLCKIKFERDLVAVSEIWSQNSNLFELLVVNNKNLAFTSRKGESGH